MFDLKLTPETVIMLTYALMLDFAGLIVTVCVLDDAGILDIVGMLTIFPWLIIRNKRVTVKEGGIMGKVKNLFTNKYLKFLTPAIGELTPVLGGIGFFWTATVLFNITETDEE